MSSITVLAILFVSVQASNAMAKRFYERHGFSFNRNHGQFLGTQIITLVEYVRPIGPEDLEKEWARFLTT